MQVASVALTIGGAVLLLLMAPAETMSEKVAIVLSIILPELLCIVVIDYGIRNPKINRQYTIRKTRDGRLRFVRRVYGPDPYGERYRYYGFVMLVIAIIFALIDVSIAWECKPVWMLIIIGLLLAVVIILIERCQRKLEKAS